MHDVFRAEHLNGSSINTVHSLEGKGQELENTCGVSVLRTYLWNWHGFRMSEDLLAQVMQKEFYEKYRDLYCSRPELFDANMPIKEYNNIKVQGASEYHIAAFAPKLGLGAYSKNNASLSDMVMLLDRKMPVFIHRAEDEADDYGHHLLAFRHDAAAHKIYVFDPSYTGKRIKGERIEHPGSVSEEGYREFEENWRNPADKNATWMMVFGRDYELFGIEGLVKF